MAEDDGGKFPKSKMTREARLAAELRANLQRRKAQARSRRDGGADERPDGLDQPPIDDALRNENPVGGKTAPGIPPRKNSPRSD